MELCKISFSSFVQSCPTQDINTLRKKRCKSLLYLIVFSVPPLKKRLKKVLLAQLFSGSIPDPFWWSFYLPASIWPLTAQPFFQQRREKGEFWNHPMYGFFLPSMEKLKVTGKFRLNIFYLTTLSMSWQKNLKSVINIS